MHHLPFKLTRKYLSDPKLNQALTVDGINFSPIFYEMLRVRLINALAKFAPAHSASFYANLVYAAKFLIRYPPITWQMLTRRYVRKHLPSKSRILVFSNGLNLASYHSVFSALSPKTSLVLLTSKQRWLDKFYLSKYQLETFPLDINAVPASDWQPIHQQILSQVKFYTAPKFKYFALIDREFRRLTMDWLPNFLKLFILARNSINQINPKLVITTHDPGPSALAFVLAAQKKRIRTLVLLNGCPSEDHFFFSDRQIVWGPLTKKYLISRGISPQRLILGGWPILFDYQQFFNHHPLRATGQINIGILASGYGHNESHQVKYFKQLLPQLAKVDNLNLITIRTHAGQIIDIQSLLKLKINQPLTLEEFIAQNNIIITQNSTAALAALVACKPTIYLPADHPFHNKGSLINKPSFLTVKRLSDLPQFIRRINSDHQFLAQYHKYRQKFLIDYCGKIDAHTGQRLAKAIQRLI